MIEHKHTYDKDGKQICCTQAEKIYTNAGAKELLKENKATGTEQSRSISIDSTFKLFIPSTISLVILLLAILFDNYYPQEWFTGWIRILWYTASYAPVGFPVIKEAFESFAKERNIFRISFDEHCYARSIFYWRIPRRRCGNAVLCGR
jgi:Cd2+/Zn2+-exporting ATPase